MVNRHRRPGARLGNGPSSQPCHDTDPQPLARRSSRGTARHARRAAAAFALYGLPLQAQGISPGPVEATMTLTDKHGRLVGQFNLDARDAKFMVDALSGMLNLEYGP